MQHKATDTLYSPSPRGWWMFAIMSVVERVRERNRRCSPEFLLHRANQNIAYVAIYTQHLALVSYGGTWISSVFRILVVFTSLTSPKCPVRPNFPQSSLRSFYEFTSLY